MTTTNDIRTWSFLALLVGGILIIAGSLAGVFMMAMWGGVGMPMMGGRSGAEWMGAGWWGAMMWWMVFWGVLTGGAAILAGVRVRSGADAATWGIVGIVAGALSFLAMGGYMVGGIAAIAGGALAVSAQTRRAGEAPPSV